MALLPPEVVSATARLLVVASPVAYGAANVLVLALMTALLQEVASNAALLQEVASNEALLLEVA